MENNNKIFMEALDICVVPGGFYRWFKREEKISSFDSKLEKKIMNYVIAPCSDGVKLIAGGAAIYSLINYLF